MEHRLQNVPTSNHRDIDLPVSIKSVARQFSTPRHIAFMVIHQPEMAAWLVSGMHDKAVSTMLQSQP